MNCTTKITPKMIAFIEHLLVEREWTKLDLSLRVSFSDQTIYNILAGRQASTKTDFLFEIAQAFGMSYGEFARGVTSFKPAPAPAPAENPVVTLEDADMVEVTMKVSRAAAMDPDLPSVVNGLYRLAENRSKYLGA